MEERDLTLDEIKLSTTLRNLEYFELSMRDLSADFELPFLSILRQIYNDPELVKNVQMPPIFIIFWLNILMLYLTALRSSSLLLSASRTDDYTSRGIGAVDSRNERR